MGVSARVYRFRRIVATAGIGGLLAATFLVITPSAMSAEEAASACAGEPPVSEVAASGPAGSIAVSTPNYEATQVGCRILAEGGSAADALIAVQLTLGLVEPQSSGLGGGALVTYLDPLTGSVDSYDATVFAPSATAGDSENPAESIGVPQTGHLLQQLHRDHGQAGWSNLVEPAAELAEDGFAVSDRLARSISWRGEELFAPGRSGEFLLNDGHMPAPGDILTNGEYADFLRGLKARRTAGKDEEAYDAIVEAGGSPEFAESLVKDWTKSDISADEAWCGDYQDFRVCGANATNSGVGIVLESLGILDRLDLQRLEPYFEEFRPVTRSTAAHLSIEAQRIAFADANAWRMDEQVDEYLAERYRELVTDPGRLDEGAEMIRQKHVLGRITPADLADTSHYEETDDEGTSHISVRDDRGRVASMTTTLQRDFGSGVAVHGFFLNNSLDNFSGGADQGEPNAREAGMKPRTTMAPVVAYDGELRKQWFPWDNNDQTIIAAGSPGGQKIPSYTIKALLGIIDWNLAPQDAIAMPNHGALGRNRMYVDGSDPEAGHETAELVRRLEGWGHDPSNGRFDSGESVVVVREDGTVEAAADPRRQGSARVVSE